MMTVKKDLSSMSDREKRKLLIKESPEIFGLIKDFKSNFDFIHFSINFCIVPYCIIYND